MDFKTVCMFLPFLGIAWGYSLGVYVKSNKKRQESDWHCVSLDDNYIYLHCNSDYYV